MTIVTLGCSFTDRYKKEIDPWPEIISKRTGERVINYGRCGTGNKYALDQLFTHLRVGKEVETVYWLMTEFDRTDVIGLTDYEPRHFFTLRPFIAGQSSEHFLRKWEESNLQGLPPGSQIEEKQLKRIRNELRLGKIIYDNTSIKHYIDNNLMYIILVQRICREFNIKLKIACALKPLYIHDPNDISLMLKSQHIKNLDLTTIMGYPFYKTAGGRCAGDLEKWSSEFGISPDDKHPNQLGHELLADFFLGEKNIIDYQ